MLLILSIYLKVEVIQNTRTFAFTESLIREEIGSFCFLNTQALLSLKVNDEIIT